MSYGYPTTYSRTRADLRADDRRSYLRELDWVLLIAAIALSVYGAILVWSASRGDQAPLMGDLQYFLKRHLLNAAIGIGLAFLVSRVDYRLMRAYTPVLYVVSFLLLLATYLPGIGVKIAGAQAWLKVPGLGTVQPGEFMKIALILAIAMILAEKRDAESEPRDSDVLQALALAAVPMAYILKYQNDTGTVLIVGTIIVAMVAVSGARTRWVIGMLVGAVVALLVAIQFHLLQDYQVGRLTSFVDPEADPTDASFNVRQAAIAIGNGGVFGRGLFQGSQTQGNFVPVNESDFIMTVAGEELGFIGAALVIVLLGIVVWRGIRIARRADDMFGRLVATGVVAWLSFQAFENIGMNLGIMPVTGVPLPFVSYGGTSMFATWIAIGLLQNVHLRHAE